MKDQDKNKILNDALNFHHKGDLDKADSLYLQVLSIDPNDFNANHFFYRGEANVRLGNIDNAKRDFNRALSIDPECELAKNSLSEISDDWRMKTKISDEKKEEMDILLNKLEPLEKDVLFQLFGIENLGFRKTHLEIGKSLNLSEDKIKQIEKKALEKLRFFKN